ncbi:MAG: hypothetical protein QOJ35_2470 [Solirubrobacteraceae bacterium]|nr:hypothetical protein [Solirubrobacteraceae bacterium]
MRTIDAGGAPVAALTLEHCQHVAWMLVAGGIRSRQVDELEARLRLRRSTARTMGPPRAVDKPQARFRGQPQWERS